MEVFRRRRGSKILTTRVITYLIKEKEVFSQRKRVEPIINEFVEYTFTLDQESLTKKSTFTNVNRRHRGICINTPGYGSLYLLYYYAGIRKNADDILIQKKMNVETSIITLLLHKSINVVDTNKLYYVQKDCIS